MVAGSDKEVEACEIDAELVVTSKPHALDGTHDVDNPQQLNQN